MFLRLISFLCIIGLCHALFPKASAQQISQPEIPIATNIVIPQARGFNLRQPSASVQISEVKANIHISEQVATTKLSINLKNPSDRQQEAELLVPVPDGAVVRAFDFAGSSPETTAKLLPKTEAKAIYHAIVNKLRDPALLEFAGYNLIRSSVFPVPAKGNQEVRLTYENFLPSDGNRIDYVLPRSESFEASATPWTINVQVKTKRPLLTLYSPSHQISSERITEGQMKATVSSDGKIEPGPFRLSYLAQSKDLTASLMAYPDPNIGGGYFLLLAGVPADAQRAKEKGIKREVTIVLDRSGSMEGEKFEQARSAALQIIERLEDDESFNIIDYSDGISSFAKEPVAKTTQNLADAKKYLQRLKAAGGTNIRDALVEALRQKPAENALPLVLFLTDGLPTVGETSEVAIRNAAKSANASNRRIFSFGVGFDVNAPLLNAIANESRATSSFVLPKENVEAKVSQVFRRLSGPVLASPAVVALDQTGEVTTRAVRELQPTELGDVFEGDQIVLLGQYQGEGTLKFKLEGNYLGQQRAFQCEFDLSKASTRNAFVPRLWASRKIARLIDQISQAGADRSSATTAQAMQSSFAINSSIRANYVSANTTTAIDPKMKELVDEIVRLSTEFGILTEYTSFLATDGVDFSKRDSLNTQAMQNFVDRAQMTRSGMGAVNQAMNSNAQNAQIYLNRSNGYLNSQMQRVEINNVQQIQDRTLFRRNSRWIDSRLLGKENNLKPDSVIEFGTPEFDKFAERLVGEGRQGLLALKADLLLVHDGKVVLVKMPSN